MEDVNDVRGKKEEGRYSVNHHFSVTPICQAVTLNYFCRLFSDLIIPSRGGAKLPLFLPLFWKDVCNCNELR